MADIFVQLGIMIVLATAGAFVARMLKQPMIPAYIIVGILLGPVWKLVDNTEIIETMSLTGIAFLLFIVGLELALKKLKDIGGIASVGAIVQVSLLFVFGFVAASFLGVYGVEAAYLGLIIAFSSTMIVIKLLSDKKELSTLHGKIIIGVLLMQDILAILALSIISSIDDFTVMVLMNSLIKAGAVFVLAYLASKYIFPKLFKFAAKSQELFFMVAISTCFFFSILLSYLGFSIAIGAFIAGISLANLPYNIEIIGKVKSLKDFFATLFFVSLGMGLVVEEITKIMYPLIILTIFVLVLKPLVIMFIGSFFGYTKKVSFFTGISLAQVSEFSIIIASQGVVLGHISSELFTLTIVLSIITMVFTSYMIKFDRILYKYVAKYLSVFDVMSTGRHLQFLPHKELKYDALLVGYDRIGYNAFKTLQKMGHSFLVIDFNPDIIKRLVARKIPCMYGDISDEEILQRLNLKKLKLVIATVPLIEDNVLIVKKTREVNSKAVIMVTGNKIREAMKLYNAGADYVIMPHFLGGERVSTLVSEYKHDLKKVIKNKRNHIEQLRERMQMDHEHPAKVEHS